MSRTSSAAKIINRISSRGADKAAGATGGLCGRLGTVVTVQPFQLTIDGIDAEFTANEVLVNPFLIGYEIEGRHYGKINMSGTEQETGVSGDISISGFGSVGDASGSASISGTASSSSASGWVAVEGEHTADDVEYEFDTYLQDGDRVAVLPVGNSRWVVLCKAVTP